MKRYAFVLIFTFILFFSYAQEKKTRIALIDFNAIGIEELTVRGIEENLLTEIINTGRFEVVERSQLNKVLKELNLSNSEDFNESTATQVGNLLGVDIILIGSVNKLGKNMTINVRGIEVKTGLASFAKKVVTKSEEDLVAAIENLALLISSASKQNGEILNKDDEEKIQKLKEEAAKKLAEEEAAKKRAEEETLKKQAEEEAAKKAEEEKNAKKKSASKLNNANIAGIALISTGGVFLITGAALFAVDMAVFGPDLDSKKKPGVSSGDYLDSYYKYVGFFGGGIGIMGVGGVMMCASIPLLVHKDKKVSLDLGFGTKINCGVKINF